MEIYLFIIANTVYFSAVVFADNQCGNPVIGSNLNKRILPRIVGGQDVVYGSWPWQVQIIFHTDKGKKQCGGSIISSRWIVSAAHCLVDKHPGTQIFAGLQGRTDYYHKNVKLYEMSRTIIHPNYLHSTASYFDIRVIQTKKNIELSDFVRPVCLATSELKDIDTITTGKVEKKCVTTGWGTINSNDQLPDTLQEVEIPLVSFEECSKLLSSYNIQESVHLCAGNLKTGGTGACVGDSGGPLVCLYNDNTWYLVGITSFGKCSSAESPGVWTRVTGVYSWIKTTTNFDKDPPLRSSLKSSVSRILYKQNYIFLFLFFCHLFQLN